MTSRRFRKSDIQFHHDRGRSRPAINIKMRGGYWPGIERAFRGSDKHEFGQDEAFWAWADAMYEADQGNYGGIFDAALDIAREDCYETFLNVVCETLGLSDKQVWAEGRSGGWLVVDDPEVKRRYNDYGMYRPEDLIGSWDAIMVAKWGKLVRWAEDFVKVGGEVDYQFVWHLHVNFYEAWGEAFVA